LADQQLLLEIEPVLRPDEVVMVRRMMVCTFQAFEYLWTLVGYEGEPITLADMKIEFGRRWKDRLLIVSDEINNGAWRIWINGDPKRQLDKQLFRERAPMEEVIEAYRLVTRLTEQLLLAA
jgi:phosphoribosylaminoimidazole-succinocarboxamide synthase